MSCYIFYISTNLTQTVNFPAWISDCDSHNPALWDLFLLMVVFALQWLSLYWVLIMLLFQFPLTFYQTQKRMAHFIAQLMTILILIGMVSVIISEMFNGKVFLNLGSSWNWHYISLTINIESSQIHFHGFRMLMLLL